MNPVPPPRPRHSQLAAAFLILHAIWLAWSATWQSPTLNEPGHLVSGIAHWTLGRFEPYRVNPPLVRMVAALPVLASHPRTNWSDFRGVPGERAEFPLGSDFIEANGTASQRFFVIARWACIPFSLLGGWMCFVWGRSLYGPASGLLACVLWCVEPNIIAHGQLITPDVAATSIGLLAAWAFWNWLRRPDWLKAILSGVALGLALLTKFSWLPLFALWPVIWCAVSRRNRNEPATIQDQSPGTASGGSSGNRRSSPSTPPLIQLIALVIIAVDVINLGYAFDGSFSRLDSFSFVSSRLTGLTPGQPGNRFQNTPLGAIPVPLPRQFVLGLDLQQKDFEHFAHDSYLRGEWRHGGWWYYYLYAAIVKVPLGLWLLVATALIQRLCRAPVNNTRLGEIILLFPAALLFLTVSSQLEFNHHFRYVLPCFGPVIIVASGVLQSAGRLFSSWVFGLAAWVAVSSAASAPFSLAYFNELAGGMHQGATHLLHSNIDWGQDLVALQEWIRTNPDKKPVYLAYYGFYDPLNWGVDAQTAPQGPFWGPPPADWSFRPGWYAISVNYVYGVDWRLTNHHAYEPFREMTPTGWCGGSIAIYEVDEALAAKLTQMLTEKVAAPK